MKRKLLLATAVIVVSGGIAAAVLLLPPAAHEAEASDPRMLPPLVKLASVRIPDAVERTFTGTVAARVQSDLGFRVPGKIVERMVGVGDQVKAGQPLLRIDSNDLNLSLTAKRNAVIAAQAAFVQAQADEKRFAVLVNPMRPPPSNTSERSSLWIPLQPNWPLPRLTQLSPRTR